MKYWRGYLIAGIVAAITWALTEFAKTHSELMDMVYPYVTRMIQSFLAGWSGGAAFCVWQVLLLLGAVLVLASLVLMIVFKWNPIQWFGWILAGVCLVSFLNTAVYGLNAHASALAEDIRLTNAEYRYNVKELEEAAIFYRDKANELASQVKRDDNGNLDYSDFQTLAQQAADGYKDLYKEQYYAVFAGSLEPVKELGWSDYYTKRGITGTTVALTGESAVNPNIPEVSLPFAMCHEMAHRMTIAVDRDADFAAYLACTSNVSVEFQYSGYLIAYMSCYDVMKTLETEDGRAALSSLEAGMTDLVKQDIGTYEDFFGSSPAVDAELCDLLVVWHIYKYGQALNQGDEENVFDPLDENAVDLTTTVIDRQ